MNTYDVKVEAKLLTALSKVLKQAQEPREYNEQTPDDNKITYAAMDPANVAMIVARTPRAERLLTRFIEKNNTMPRVPVLSYKGSEYENIAGYSNEYLKKLLTIVNIDDDKTTIKLLRDYPLTLENDDWTCILAPRVVRE